jgi:hypothetical protein
MGLFTNESSYKAGYKITEREEEVEKVKNESQYVRL